MNKKSDVLFLLIDVQGRLFDMILHKELLLKTIPRLIQTTKILNIPLIYTEQAPEKIGTTPEFIQKHLEFSSIKKNTFSCCECDEFLSELEKINPKKIILFGIETHVCIFQTVRDLIRENYEVHIVLDAISTRSELNHAVAIERMKALGAIVTTSEMVITEYIHGADHPKFKDIIQLLKA